MQKKLIEASDHNLEIPKKKAKDILRYYNVPKHLRPAVIKDMSYFSMIKSVSRFRIKVINPEFSKEIEDASKVNQMVGLFEW